MSIEIIDNSDDAIKAMSDAVEAALEAMGQQAVSFAKGNITAAGRVNTGAMSNSVNHEVSTGESAVYVGTNQSYAIFNELGTGIYLDGGGGRQTPWSYQDEAGNWHRTRGMKPIHFLKNAVQDHQSEIIEIGARTIKNHNP